MAWDGSILVSTGVRKTGGGIYRLQYVADPDYYVNATNWAAKQQPVDPLNPERKAPLSYWTAGGTIGGPIARDRLFLFADYQTVRRESGPANDLTTVATDAMRAGDFSYLLEGPNPQQMYDPLTTRPDPVNPGR